MEIIIHNQCPLALSGGLWINSVLMGKERPPIPISSSGQHSGRGRDSDSRQVQRSSGTECLHAACPGRLEQKPPGIATRSKAHPSSQVSHSLL